MQWVKYKNQNTFGILKNDNDLTHVFVWDQFLSQMWNLPCLNVLIEVEFKEGDWEKCKETDVPNEVKQLYKRYIKQSISFFELIKTDFC